MKKALLAVFAAALLAGCFSLVHDKELGIYDAAATVNGVYVRVETEENGRPLRASVLLPVDAVWNVESFDNGNGTETITITRADVVTEIPNGEM